MSAYIFDKLPVLYAKDHTHRYQMHVVEYRGEHKVPWPPPACQSFDALL